MNMLPNMSSWTDEERISFAIRVVARILNRSLYEEWHTWAEGWLSGRDRSTDSAWATLRVGKNVLRIWSEAPKTVWGQRGQDRDRPVVTAAYLIAERVANSEVFGGPVDVSHLLSLAMTSTAWRADYLEVVAA